MLRAKRYEGHTTKKGPGRIHLNPIVHITKTGILVRGENPAGTKLIKRFIKDARGEAHEYRSMLRAIAPHDKRAAL